MMMNEGIKISIYSFPSQISTQWTFFNIEPMCFLSELIEGEFEISNAILALSINDFASLKIFFLVAFNGNFWWEFDWFNS